MNKTIKALGIFVFFFLGINTYQSQLYSIAVGGQVDSGVGESLVGINAKSYLHQNFSLEGSVVYGGGFWAAQFVPQLVVPISEQTDGLVAYAGAGPSYIKGGHTSVVESFNFVGTVGVEYELVDLPISFSADWRPRYYTKDPGFYNTMQIKKGFEPGRWSLVLRFTF